MEMTELLTRQQVAAMLGCSVDTVSREITRGKLGTTMLGRQVRISVDQVDRYLDSVTIPAPVRPTE